MAEEQKEKPGIVITGTENFEGNQGFVSAEDAAKAGVVTTGVTSEVEVAEEAPKATKKVATKTTKKSVSVKK